MAKIVNTFHGYFFYLPSKSRLSSRAFLEDKCSPSFCFPTGLSSDSDLISLTIDADSLVELDDGMASNQDSPSTSLGLSFAAEHPVLSSAILDQEWTKSENERESRGLFTGSLKAKLGRRDYLDKAGELIKLALKKEEEEDYEAAFGFYRKGVDLLLEGVQGMISFILTPILVYLSLYPLCSKFEL